MKLPASLTLITSFLLILSPSAQAAAMAGWELLGSTQANRSDAPTFQIGLTAGDFTIANTLVNEGTFASAPTTLSGNQWSTDSQADLTKYFSLSAGPLSGESLDFQFLQMPLWRETSVNDSGPTLWEVRSSLDGYASVIGSAVDIGSAGFNTPAITSFDLTSLPTTSSTVTFRIYGYGAANSSGSGGVHVTDAKVYIEAVAIPEPATYGMIFSFAIAGYVFASRRKRSLGKGCPKE